MKNNGGKIKLQNRLWSARKRCRLRQKQVARLLGKTIQEVSRYEHGSRLPELRTLLALEVVYGKPLRALFPEIHKRVLKELGTRLTDQKLFQSMYADLIKNISEGGTVDYCSFEESLRAARLSELERMKIRAHATRVVNGLTLLTPRDS